MNYHHYCYQYYYYMYRYFSYIIGYNLVLSMLEALDSTFGEFWALEFEFG